MTEFTNKNLFGIVLFDSEGQNRRVKIIENNGDEYEGYIIGFTRGGYQVKDEVIPAAVRLWSESFTCRIKIDDIERLFIEE